MVKLQGCWQPYNSNLSYPHHSHKHQPILFSADNKTKFYNSITAVTEH